MSTLRKSLLTGLTVLAGSAATQAAEVAAADVLRTADRVAGAISSCPASADDVVGEVALRLWSRHQDVVVAGQNAAYVQQSVVNARRDQLRRDRRRVLASDLFADGDLGVLLEDRTDVDSPEELAAVHEFRASLGDADRQVLALLEDGHSDRAIARTLDLSRHAVRTAVQRIQRRAVHAFPDAGPRAAD